ncbi:30S ribosomal protein S17 [candidate division WWE3 bacterium CG_4_9_14_0_2_um_filter_35_11]|uniref:30S ribosomal protein S17 n=1 Tax=candidate division WWE3 bacterium CG_4_9_14_0_2_um_filter_35_11 TaxID=1975077 RepID=A0A2M8EL23_UNCKA|nr:MAG: 30S ribosomal protein S17 [candidate division WWE3 bacterium CG10_big_fil_rev_8_21_14_0_10_35_32]PJC23428.1 MAG: 30S ribosomal protein S17 [candidate division WWE3 bacterium CG_4_9_14_0_2_um_filter_35_11]
MSGKILKGNVVLSKMLKTLRVKVGFSKKHARYNKRFVFHNTFKVHCEDVSKYKEGDLVQIIECAPISKSKSWKLLDDVKETK